MIGGLGVGLNIDKTPHAVNKGAIQPSYQTMGGGHAQVGRPGHEETGAPEGALCMTTIKPRRKTPRVVMLCKSHVRATKPDRCFSATGKR